MPGGRACNASHFKAGVGINMVHDFFASHHGSGPWDNYGKDPRRGMDKDVAFGKFTRYSYEHCYDWCVENMSKPPGDKKHLGRFGSNGKYIYRAYSDGTNANLRGFPVASKERFFQRLPGSNEPTHDG